jgi:hypothetical protein
MDDSHLWMTVGSPISFPEARRALGMALCNEARMMNSSAGSSLTWRILKVLSEVSGCLSLNSCLGRYDSRPIALCRMMKMTCLH